MKERGSENPNMWEIPRFDPPTYLRHLREFLKGPSNFIRDISADHEWVEYLQKLR